MCFLRLDVTNVVCEDLVFKLLLKNFKKKMEILANNRLVEWLTMILAMTSIR